MPAFVKYTVFISSTHEDLEQEREQVADAILKLGHIPCGMEQFSAGSGRGWNVITQTIDICDYYILIVAGRYGTLFPNELVSWTEKEYDYARSRGLDPLVFVRQKDHVFQSRMDDDPIIAVRRRAFVRRIEDDCRREPWTTGDDLCARVTMALTKQIADDQRWGKTRPGWYRGDDLPGNAQVTSELARLSAENADLRASLARALTPPRPTLDIQTHYGEPVADYLETSLVTYSAVLPNSDVELSDEEAADALRQQSRQTLAIRRRTRLPASMKGLEELLLDRPTSTRTPEPTADEIGAYKLALRQSRTKERTEIDTWAHFLSSVIWIRLQIANVGQIPARDVRVRVVVSGAKFAALGTLPHHTAFDLSTDHHDEHRTRGVTRLSRPDAAETILQHKLDVGVSRAEPLLGMAFFVEGVIDGERNVDVTIDLDEETGVRMEHRIHFRVTRGQIHSGTPSEIFAHANDARSMKRNMAIPTDTPSGERQATD